MINNEIIEKIGERLISNHWTVAVAESVTAGNLQAALSLAENACMFFQGGITTYNLGQKTRLLKVEPIHAESCNCVSPLVAGQMAISSSRMFLSSWGIGLTGYASPIPECGVFRLHAYVAFSKDRRLLHSAKIRSGEWSPELVQEDFVNQVLGHFCNVLNRAVLQERPQKKHIYIGANI